MISPDPSQGMIYCRNCRYVLNGLPENRCPECGTGFDPADATTFLLSLHQDRWTAKPVRCFVSWSVLMVGTYLSFLSLSVVPWIGSLVLFLVVRKLGRNHIPFRVGSPRDPSSGQIAAECLAGCLLAPVYLVLEIVGPFVVVGGMFILAWKLESAGVSRPLFALVMTLPALIPYGHFILADVRDLRQLSKPAPGCCLNCHFDLKGGVAGGCALPARCPNCSEPVPHVDAEGRSRSQAGSVLADTHRMEQ